MISFFIRKYHTLKFLHSFCLSFIYIANGHQRPAVCQVQCKAPRHNEEENRAPALRITASYTVKSEIAGRIFN